MHRDHILTSDLREAFDFLIAAGETSGAFDVRENTPKGKNRKKSVNYYYAGRRTLPFAFIVNSGERKDYHLFYIRNPRPGDLDTVKQHVCASKVNVNPREEITVQVHNRGDAESVWRIVEDVRLK
jgi:hypothetical protein